MVELLVVIAVIGILAALLLPVLSSVKQRALRIKCLSNVKQVALIYIEYAHDNNDRLPYDIWMTQYIDVRGMEEPTFSMAADPVCAALRNNYGLKSGIWGCPANVPPQLIGDKNYGDAMSYIVGLSAWELLPSNRNFMITPQLVPTKSGPGQYGAYAFTDPSRRVLVADFSLTSVSNNDPSLWQTYDWGASFPSGTRSDHVDSRNKVIGCNDAMLDGHAQWVRAKDMRPCTKSNNDWEPGQMVGGWSWMLWW